MRFAQTSLRPPALAAVGFAVLAALVAVSAPKAAFAADGEWCAGTAACKMFLQAAKACTGTECPDEATAKKANTFFKAASGAATTAGLDIAKEAGFPAGTVFTVKAGAPAPAEQEKAPPPRKEERAGPSPSDEGKGAAQKVSAEAGAFKAALAACGVRANKFVCPDEAGRAALVAARNDLNDICDMQTSSDRARGICYRTAGGAGVWDVVLAETPATPQEEASAEEASAEEISEEEAPAEEISEEADGGDVAVAQVLGYVGFPLALIAMGVLFWFRHMAEAHRQKLAEEAQATLADEVGRLKAEAEAAREEADGLHKLVNGEDGLRSQTESLRAQLDTVGVSNEELREELKTADDKAARLQGDLREKGAELSASEATRLEAEGKATSVAQQARLTADQLRGELAQARAEAEEAAAQKAEAEAAVAEAEEALEAVCAAAGIDLGGDAEAEEEVNHG